MAKSPESSKAGRAVRARGRPSCTTPFAHLTGPSRSREGGGIVGRAFDFESFKLFARGGMCEPTFTARTSDSRGHHIRRSSTSALVDITSGARAPRPSSASHPALDLPKGTGNENADAGCPNVRIHVSRKNSYTSMPRGRAGQGVRLCDPAPAPHPPSHARQPHATRCARRAE